MNKAELHKIEMELMNCNDSKSKAKLANATPFSNFILVEPETEKGKATKLPRKINELITDLKERFLGYPKNIDGELFDFDKKTKKIRPILIQLFALASFGSATPPKKKAIVATKEATKETKLKICPACPSHKCSPI
jgi:hypothetical protein